MSDNEVSVNFTGDVSGLNKSVTQAKSTVASFGDVLKSLFSSVDTSGLTSGFKNIGDDADKAGDQSSSALEKIKTTFEEVTLGAGALAGAAIGSMMGMATAAVAIGEPLHTAAGAFDQTIASMGSLNAVASRSGVSLDALGASFLKLQSNAASGDAGTVAALKAIGLTSNDVAGLTQDALAVRMASSFASAADSSNKAAAGVALFGADVAGKLVPQLDQGAARLKDLEDAANRAGVVIGADLSQRIAGTSALMDGFGDAIQELRETVKGMALESFAQFKGAIDGMLASFTAVIRNVASLVEWFDALDGAAQKGADNTGFLTSAVNVFARGVVRATTGVQEFALKSAQYLENLGVAFGDLSTVAGAFAGDLVAMATNSASTFYTVYQEAISGVIGLFGDLVTAGRSAFSFDLSGVRSSFSQFSSDTDAMGAKFKAALTPSLTGTVAAMDVMRAHAAAESAALGTQIAKLEAAKTAQLALIAAGGAKGPTTGTNKVGDPSAPEKDGGAGNKANAAIAEIDGELAVLRKGLASKEEIYSADVQLKLMSESEKLAKTKTALDDEFAAEKALLNKELALDNLSAEQKAQAQAKMKEATQKYVADTQKIMDQSTEALVKPWFTMVDTMSSSLSESIMGMLAKTKTLGDAIRSMAQAVVGQFVKMGVDVVADWGKRQITLVAQAVVGQTGVTTAAAAGAGAREAITISSLAADGATFVGHILGQIAALAAQAFAGVTAFLAPVLGPAAVGPAAAVEATVIGAGAAIGGSFAVGSWALGSDMLAQVHRGEMIVPAAQTPWAQSLMSNAAGAGAAQGGGDMHVHLNVNAVDGPSVMALFRNNSTELAKLIGKTMRQNPSTRGAY